MAALTVTTIDINGVVPTFVPADVLGDTYANTGREFVMVTNGSGAPITMTVVLVKTTLNTGETIEPTTITIAPGDTALAGAFSTQLYSANVALTYSDVTSLTIQIFRVVQATTGASA